MAVDQRNKRNTANEADRKMLKLLRAFNDFPCIRASCISGAGPRSKTDTQSQFGWTLNLNIERTETGWFVLEFLAWLINNDFKKAGIEIQFTPNSQPPYLNVPGNTLFFEVCGSYPPDKTAEAIRRARKECFVPPQNVQDFILESYGPDCLQSYVRGNQKASKNGSNNQPANTSLEQLKAASGDRISLPAGVIRFRR